MARRVPEERHGYFFDGDSYVVLISERGLDGKPAHTAHAWMGVRTTVDESASAIVKLSKLDAQLGGNVALKRQVQDHETADFKQLFYPAMMVCAGGIDSALEGHEAKDGEEVKTRLLWLRGKGRDIAVREAPVANAAYLNRSDVFVLATGDTVFQYNGDRAGVFEKNKGREVAQRLRGDRKNCRLVVFDHPVGDGDDANQFFEMLGGRKEIAAEAREDRDEGSEAVLYRIVSSGESGGELAVEEISRGAGIRETHLSSRALCLLDLGTEVWVRAGEDVPAGERHGALVRAQQFLRLRGAAPHIPIARICEGHEPHEFWAHFR